MNHYDKKFDLHDATVFDTLEFNPEWAHDPKNLNELLRFAKTFQTDKSGAHLEGDKWFDFMNAKWDKFYDMLLEAIKYNNIEGLSLLWDSVYWDRDSPNYEWCLEKASMHGNLKTFQHCLYAFGNYTAINGTDPVSYSTLKQHAENNDDPSVLAYLERLEPCVIDGEISPMSNDNGGSLLEELLKEDESSEWSEKYKLYQTLSQYVK